MSDFIEPLPKSLHLAWVIVPATIFAILSVFTSIFLPTVKAYAVPIFLALLLLNVWLSGNRPIVTAEILL